MTPGAALRSTRLILLRIIWKEYINITKSMAYGPTTGSLRCSSEAMNSVSLSAKLKGPLHGALLVCGQREVDDPLFDKIGDSRFWAARIARRSERQRGRGTCSKHVPSNPSRGSKRITSPVSKLDTLPSLKDRKRHGGASKIICPA